MDEIVLDLYPLDPQSRGHRAAHPADGEPYRADVLRDMPDDELQTALREQSRPQQYRGRRNRGDDDENGKGEQQPAHGMATWIRASARS